MLRLTAAFIVAACAMALATAFTAQYVFGLMPCNLCLIERVPFALAGLLGLAALICSPHRRLLLTLAGALLLVNGGIAFYHVGVEQHWWASAVCARAEGGVVDVSDLAAAMSRPVEVPCDVPAWSYRGVTMAALNIIFSGGLGLLAVVLARRAR
jgi:disulfide bond formation protein DsbB